MDLIGIPRSVGRSIESLLTGGVRRAVWVLFVTLVVLLVAYVAFAINALAGAIAGIALTVIWGEEIRMAIDDTYERRWYKLPHRLWPW